MPVHLTSPVRAVAPLEHVLQKRGVGEREHGCGGLLPLRVHVEQVHEEVVGQRPGPLGEDAEFGLPDVRIQHAQAADQHRHLGSGQRQQLRPIHQQLLCRSFVSAVRARK